MTRKLTGVVETAMQPAVMGSGISTMFAKALRRRAGSRIAAAFAGLLRRQQSADGRSSEAVRYLVCPMFRRVGRSSRPAAVGGGEVTQLLNFDPLFRALPAAAA